MSSFSLDIGFFALRKFHGCTVKHILPWQHTLYATVYFREKWELTENSRFKNVSVVQCPWALVYSMQNLHIQLSPYYTFSSYRWNRMLEWRELNLVYRKQLPVCTGHNVHCQIYPKHLVSLNQIRRQMFTITKRMRMRIFVDVLKKWNVQVHSTPRKYLPPLRAEGDELRSGQMYVDKIKKKYMA